MWRYCMRLASSGVGCVRRVRLALLYVGSCVGVLWMMFWMRLACHQVCGGGASDIGCRPKASRTRRTPPTPDDASRMQYRHKTCATSPGPGPIVVIVVLDARAACCVPSACGSSWRHTRAHAGGSCPGCSSARSRARPCCSFVYVYTIINNA